MKLIILLLILVGCSDARKGAILSLGQSREVKCYSGGQLIYHGFSTGKIENEEGSDGYFFKDTNGKFIEINADCLIIN